MATLDDLIDDDEWLDYEEDDAPFTVEKEEEKEQPPPAAAPEPDQRPRDKQPKRYFPTLYDE